MLPLILRGALIVTGQLKIFGKFAFIVALDDVPADAPLDSPAVVELVALAQKCCFELGGYRQEWSPPERFTGVLPERAPDLDIGPARIWRA